MRNTMIAAATALVLSVGFAAPSFADDNNYGNRNPSGSYAQNQQYDDDDYDRGDRRGDNGTWRRDRDDRNFDRHERRFDQWERGWRDDFGPQYGIWVRMNNSNWVPLHGASAQHITGADLDGNGQGDVVVDLGSANGGIWARMNNSNWVQINGVGAASITAGQIDGN